MKTRSGTVVLNPLTIAVPALGIPEAEKLPMTPTVSLADEDQFESLTKVSGCAGSVGLPPSVGELFDEPGLGDVLPLLPESPELLELLFVPLLRAAMVVFGRMCSWPLSLVENVTESLK